MIDKKQLLFELREITHKLDDLNFILNNSISYKVISYYIFIYFPDDVKLMIITKYKQKGSQDWFKNNFSHRSGNRPARIYANSQKHWLNNGQLHNEVGPAIINDYKQGYFLFNKRIGEIFR